MRIKSTMAFTAPFLSLCVCALANENYAARPGGSGFEASNSKQGLTVRFTAKQVAVNRETAYWVMALRSYGYENSMRAVEVATPHAAAGRLQYRRGLLTEWYLNGPGGLEQGFTVSQPPGRSNGRPLTIAIEVSGNLTASLNRDAKSLTLTPRRGESLRYGGLTAYDRNGRELPSWLQLRGRLLSIRVAHRDAVFPITIDPTLDVVLTASTSTLNLGVSVGVSGNTVVAASGNSVYVYSKPSSGWVNMTQTAVLNASDGSQLTAAAVFGNTIAAVAYEVGNVYVFVEPPGGWVNMTESAKLSASDAPGYGFISVAINENTIVAGAAQSDEIGVSPKHTIGPVGPGAAYVFLEPAGGWTNMTETAKLTASDGVTGDDFGWSASISGNTIVAGAPNATIGGKPLIGAVYVFVEPPSGWATTTETAKLSGAYVEFVDTIGQSVAVSGSTVLAGGYGLAYIFVKLAGGWISTNVQTASLTDSDGRTTSAAGGFGQSVAVNNNFAIVGAPGLFNLNVYSVADIYEKPATGWANMTQTSRVHSSVDGGGEAYGWSVGVSDTTFVVGYPNLFFEGNYVFVY
jgi:hypothetical protein